MNSGCRAAGTCLAGLSYVVLLPLVLLNFEPPKEKSDKLFNVVMYGIKESQPNSSRATRLQHDMKAMQNVLANIDLVLSKSSIIRDFHWLGKYNLIQNSQAVKKCAALRKAMVK